LAVLAVTPDERAEFRVALRDTADQLLGYFERRVSSREDAADLMAETMLQAWRRSAALPSAPERRRMWLFTIAANVLANHRRSTRRRTALAERLRSHLASSASEPDPAEAIAVRDAVRRLESSGRELVMLINWDGFTIVDAAELLGINPSTARSRYAAARDELKRALSPVAHA
jgi:RNA polymerase sigma-70 factor (ECF subfamily)